MPLFPSARAAVPRLQRWLCAFALSIALPGLAAAATMVDTIVVKYRDDAVGRDVQGVSDSDLRKLGNMHKSALSNLGRTRDGGFRLALDPPLAIDDARAAMNRLRLDPAVLYVAIAERNPTAKRVAARDAVDGRPVRSLIVKYKDPRITAAALADQPLAVAQLQRAADIAGMPVASLRAMAGGAYVLRLFAPVSPLAAYSITDALENEPDVEYASPDLWKYPTLVPNDTCYAANTNAACFNSLVPTTYMFEWHLMPGGNEVGGANLPPAWDLTTGSDNIRVGVIDTGFLYSHPDLAGRAIGGYDFINDFAVANDGQPGQTAGCTQGYDPRLYDPSSPPCVNDRDSDPSDPGDWINAADYPGTSNSWFYGCTVSGSSFHGSHVAGTIGALTNNSTGVAGINWVSKIVPLRVLGKCGGYTSDIVDAITWGSGGSVAGVPANAYPARVLNLSLGGSGPCEAVEQNAINGAIGRGTVVVISAGNTNTNASNNSPGNCLGNITVAATQRQGIKAQYSAFGTSVEMSAPGGGRDYPETPSVIRNYVVSSINSGATTPASGTYIYAGYWGTSMAAPHIAGVASLMLSRNESLTPAQVLSIMQSTARPFPVVAGATCPSATSCNCTTSLCGAGLLDAGAAVAAVPVAPTGGRRAIDFNDDGKGDLLWRNTSSGATAMWLMNGTSALSAATIFTNGAYAAQRTGDLNGDGKTDIIWRNASAGTAAWIMNGTTATSSTTLLGDPAWDVVRVGDLNGDGKEDLVWYKASTGQTAVWLMNGLATTSSAFILTSPVWSVSFIGDFNGDGKADLVWRNSSTGEVAIWLMNGTSVISSAVIMGPSAWGVTHVGDFDGDGKSDLVWRNSSTGQTAIWLMNGLSATTATTIYSNAAYAVTNVGDFNGDGKSDLVWRNASTGQTALWLMNGTAVSSSGVVFTSTAWSVTHVGDTNGDGKSDLVWRNSSGGATAVWLMNGLSTTSSATLSSDANWVVSPPDGN